MGLGEDVKDRRDSGPDGTSFGDAWRVAGAGAVSPAGAYPSVDSWGNKICKRSSDGGAATTEVPRNQTCPNGAYPTVDSYGNKICRSSGSGGRSGTDYYDTSKGCPAGTYPSVDSYGNKVCKKF